jgi:alpha-tubulin suppressor-like RCC1 family protein
VNGGVQCWGANNSGQLGNDFMVESFVPVAVGGFPGAVQTLALGTGHTCALVNGGVQCWGANASGELGNNSTEDSDVPVPVQGLAGPGSGVQAIAAGDVHSCAVVSGAAKCWGSNLDGELGNGSTTQQSNVPVFVQGLGSPGSGVQALAAGAFHTCALVNGGVQCWGDNSHGELGNNSDAGSNVPVAVQGLGSGVQAIAAGAVHTCALVNGGVQCWGWNGGGQLGNGSTADSDVPVPVQELGPGSGVQAIAGGLQHACALVASGVQCWGANQAGQLGKGSLTSSSVPVAVQGLGSPGSGVQGITAGDFHTCALVDGGVECWGLNANGQLGDNSDGGSPVPVAVGPWAQ